MKKMLCFLLAIFIIPACGKKAEESKLNLYIDIKDKNTVSVIKYLGDQYEKENSGVKINYMIPINEIDKVTKTIDDGDIIITSRQNMINLGRDGQLSDMGNYYESLKLYKDYMHIISSYGEYNNINFGIGFLPRNIKIIYDKEFWDKNKLDDKDSIVTLKKAVNFCINRNIKIPVVLDQDMDINNFIFSLISNQIVDTQNLDEIYDSSKDNYKNIPLDKSFKEIKNLYDNRILSKNIFYTGSESDFKNLSSSMPFIITSMNYYNNKDLKYVISSTPVYYINSIISVPMGSKNKWDSASFIKFLYSEKAAKLLNSHNYASGNKKYDKDTYLNVFTMFNLPDKFQKPVDNKVSSILGGVYRGNEWTDILDEVYK